MFLLKKKKTIEKSGSKEEKPIDPRYGNLDPNLNLSLKIADPSYVALDKQMADQQRAGEIKSEVSSDSDKSKTKTKTKAK